MTHIRRLAYGLAATCAFVAVVLVVGLIATNLVALVVFLSLCGLAIIYFAGLTIDDEIRHEKLKKMMESLEELENTDDKTDQSA